MATRSVRTDLEAFHVYDLYLPTRTLVLGSVSNDEGDEIGLDSNISLGVIKNLHILDSSASNGDKPINIILNNPGGSSAQGVAIYDYIKLCKNHVNIYVVGQALSMAAWILQGGDKRYMTQHSSLMLHTGTISLPEDHPEIAKRTLKQWEKEEAIFENILLEKIRINKPRFTLKQVKDLLRFDFFLDAKEALEYNLIDEII